MKEKQDVLDCIKLILTAYDVYRRIMDMTHEEATKKATDLPPVTVKKFEQGSKYDEYSVVLDAHPYIQLFKDGKPVRQFPLRKLIIMGLSEFYGWEADTSKIEIKSGWAD